MLFLTFIREDENNYGEYLSFDFSEEHFNIVIFDLIWYNKFNN